MEIRIHLTAIAGWVIFQRSQNKFEESNIIFFLPQHNAWKMHYRIQATAKRHFVTSLCTPSFLDST
jgi:hypothetical protein